MTLCLSVAWWAEALTLMTYNVKGNGVADWSTNSAQVQAIGRVVSHVNADVITFNEIPASKTWEMTNFVKVYLPGYHLATNSGTDNFIRSVIASRYPIVRSTSWLARSSLTNFGYDGLFTRDLFEAEIQVTGASEPLHVFTTHLKCCSDTASKQRRGAEARAISNFLATVFLPTYGTRPYVLTGDMNEDIERPYAGSQFAIETLTSAPTGLQLTRPVNSVTGDERTWSLQSLPLSIRFDYVMPCGLLYSNTVTSGLFRSDVLTNPPVPLLGTDAASASDHVPVVMRWSYPDPALVLHARASNGVVQVSWPSLVGRRFTVQGSGDCVSWTNVLTGVVATESNTFVSFGTGEERVFWRVVRE
jgi:endonuclease/exonuclease/phosphatase family metal-dependent hydrolase